MNVYVWDDLNNMSSSYHSDGGVVVIADNIDAAYALLRTKGEGTYGCLPVPEDSGIFGKAPTAIYPIIGQSDPRIFSFPNAGCC